jgi:prepilin-type N-terminal cleavage/methylation domain-containing protein
MQYRNHGFTLIELMVVVVIIAIISGIAIPALLSTFDQVEEVALESEAPVSQGDVKETFAPPPGVPPVIDSAAMDLSLLSTYHRIGLEVFTRYEVTCEGRIEFRRAESDTGPVLLTLPFPEGKAEARDVRLTLTRKSDSTTWTPDNVVYHGQRLHWSGDIPDSDAYLAELHFVALGRDQFEYRLPPARQLNAIDINLELKGASSSNIPDHALQPTDTKEQRLAWTFSNLVTDRAIILEIPAELSPLGRVSLLVKLVAIAVLLFGFGFWYISKPGQLTHFRWGHFLLLALTYSSFFVIFSVISFHEVMNTWEAMLLSAALSLPLLLFHVSQIMDFSFAVGRALPLAVFTLALVINGVYGGALRDYLFIAAFFVVLVFFTLTYNGWAATRAAYREVLRKKNEKKLNAVRSNLLSEVKQVIEEIQITDLEAASLISPVPQSEVESEQNRVIQRREPVVDLMKRYHELAKRLPDPGYASHEIDHAWYNALEHEINQFKEEARQVWDDLKTALDGLKNRRRSLRSQKAEQAHFCIACGRSVPFSPHCQECGAPRYHELKCRECQCPQIFPVHLIPPETEAVTLYCPQCGEPFQPVTPPPEPADAK